MIKTILWDVDGTLLDFFAAERAAIRACFARFSLGECTDALIARYSAVNGRWWRRLERGESTKAEILVGRFEEFFSSEGIFCPDIPAFNREYQLRLGDTIVFRDDAGALVASLRGRVRQYAVTNGTLAAQSRKLERSGLDRLLDGVFISELVGAEKPSPAFFRRVLSDIAPADPRETLIVGDSLTSDMRGGNNAGILCCWYDPENRPLPEDLSIHWHIRNLNQLRDILADAPRA